MSSKDDFLKIFNASRDSLSAFDEKVRQTARDIRFLQDTAECMDEWVSVMPEESVNPAYWDYLIGAWAGVSQGTQSFQNFDSSVGSFSAIASSAGMTVNSVVDSVTVPPEVQYPEKR
jgi:hypothetical protein